MIGARRIGLAVCGAAALALATGPAAAAPSFIGGNDSWGAYQSGAGKKRICFVHGAPEKSRGKYKRRGKTYLQVTHRPGEKERHVASVTAGYIYKKGSRVDLVVDGRKFSLFTHGDTAWGEDEKADRAIVRALKKGKKMTVRGRSSRDTLTTDSYSLAGFTKAYRAASKACKVKPL
ncbi:MAG: invasion associated locus B family protein [Defluviicoccus sp.]|nr:invasion associated locus B family protein [Defluviicoccus sp.]